MAPTRSGTDTNCSTTCMETSKTPISLYYQYKRLPKNREPNKEKLRVHPPSIFSRMKHQDTALSAPKQLSQIEFGQEVRRTAPYPTAVACSAYTKAWQIPLWNMLEGHTTLSSHNWQIRHGEKEARNWRRAKTQKERAKGKKAIRKEAKNRQVGCERH